MVGTTEQNQQVPLIGAALSMIGRALRIGEVKLNAEKAKARIAVQSRLPPFPLDSIMTTSLSIVAVQLLSTSVPLLQRHVVALLRILRMPL